MFFVDGLPDDDGDGHDSNTSKVKKFICQGSSKRPQKQQQPAGVKHSKFCPGGFNLNRCFKDCN